MVKAKNLTEDEEIVKGGVTHSIISVLTGSQESVEVYGETRHFMYVVGHDEDDTVMVVARDGTDTKQMLKFRPDEEVETI